MKPDIIIFWIFFAIAWAAAVFVGLPMWLHAAEVVRQFWGF